jgi:hypothetical protein
MRSIQFDDWRIRESEVILQNQELNRRTESIKLHRKKLTHFVFVCPGMMTDVKHGAKTHE